MRIVTVTANLLAALLVAVPAVAVAGMFAPRVPYLGLATAFAPWFIAWLIMSAAAGAALAGLLWIVRRGRVAALIAATAVVVLVGASLIATRMITAVERAGADIDIAALFTLTRKQRVPPDAEAVYTEFDGKPLTLSIYRPRDEGRAAPVLVYVHGGGWVAGNRFAHSDDLRWFADRGWLTITVAYPLSTPEHPRWDVTQGQIGCALAWIGREAHRYGGDPRRLSISGDSAGGNLAINAAYMRATGTLRSACGGEIPSVSAVSALYPAVNPAGMFDNDYPVAGRDGRAMAATYTGGTPQQYPDRYASIASAAHISPAAPPTLILLPEDDHLVPPADTHRFVEQARAAGVATELVTVPYADHVFDARPGSIGKQAYRQLTERWLREHGQAP
ncbi:alpha/beta hydrolase [Mycolicibacterium phlei]